tara:strand:+ start:30 stop:542 length:513 start_codon:yes stop_codon:yes gene_type:complete
MPIKNLCKLLLVSFLKLPSFYIYSNDIDKIQLIKEIYNINKIELIDFNENISSIKEKKASFYILNFWASWCAPCIKEMKSLNSLQFKEKNLRVITISQDKDIKYARAFFNKNKYKNLEKYFDKEKKIISMFPIRGIPTTFIANKDFEVFAKVEGVIEWDSKNFIEWLKSY